MSFWHVTFPMGFDISLKENHVLYKCAYQKCQTAWASMHGFVLAGWLGGRLGRLLGWWASSLLGWVC